MTDRYVMREARGSITVTPGALAGIVQQATETVEGARLRRRRRRLEVRVEAGRAHVELDLAAPYGVVLPDLARSVQERVTEALEAMCGLEVEGVDVAIEELDGG